MQTSSPFKNMRTNFLTRNLTTGPHYPSLISHLGCINMPVLHTSPHPGGACMALVPRCDTNQGRWRAPLSCKHQSLLVLFKCLPSLFLLSLTLAQPLPRFTLHPRLQPSLCLSPSFSSPSKSFAERRGSLQARGCWGRPLSWGSACVSAHGAVSRPNQVHFIFKCYNQASDPQGALYGCGPRSQGQDGDLIAQAEERRGGAKWFRGWMSNKKAFFLSCHVNFNPYSIWSSLHTRGLPQWLSSGL